MMKIVTFFLSRSYNSNTVHLTSFEPSVSPDGPNDVLRTWWYWAKENETDFHETFSLEEVAKLGVQIEPEECINLSNGVRWRYENGRPFPKKQKK